MASKKGSHCPLNGTPIVLISKICSWRTNFIAHGKDLLNWIAHHPSFHECFVTDNILLRPFVSFFLDKQFRKERLFNGF